MSGDGPGIGIAGTGAGTGSIGIGWVGVMGKLWGLDWRIGIGLQLP